MPAPRPSPSRRPSRTLRRAVRAAFTCLAAALPAAFPGATAPAAAAEDPFAANVRPTEPRTPTEQRATLKVPAGFEVQLVAHEPDVHKPMNLAFDALGRLWVTTSREYPFPVPVGQAGRDRVMVFEDFAPDGRARKVTEFAGGLNIPTGVYPFRSRNAEGRETWKAVVWSIPHVWLMEDTDGDGRADRRERLYGPFDATRDTHGNQSSFRRGFDGWLYATHGFNNDSHVTGADGHRVDLNSGNTYRLRLDGTRIEHHTHGQVNPFGLAWDPRGDLYSSDCHSEPIYLLIAGGYYPSFGKPHDGLGFAPNMMERIRGSTAIDGISYYADDLWPAEYADSVFVGDVMTSRVYRDTAVARGSGRVTRQQPDFIVSEDPWFRPVDTTFGPDGAMYVADFYNRIIGHYEVPLNHPGRDRERGRLWRVVRVNEAGKPVLRPAALAQDLEGLVGELGSPSLTRRMLAMNDLADRFGTNAVPRLREVLSDLRGRSSGPEVGEHAFRHVHTLWLLERLGAGDWSPRGFPLGYTASRANPLLQVHARRILVERGEQAAASGDPSARERLKPLLLELAVPSLRHPDPLVRRVSAHALATTPAWEHVKPLLAALAAAEAADPHLVYSLRQALRNQLLDELVMARVLAADWSDAEVAALADVEAADPHLVYSLRQALRNQLLDEPVMARVLAADWTDAEVAALADVAVAAPAPGAGAFLVRHLDRLPPGGDLAERALVHAARHAPAGEVEALVAAARRRTGADPDFQLALFRSLQQGFAQRGSELSPTLTAWAADLARDLLASVGNGPGWVNEPVPGAGNPADPWDLQERPCADGVTARLMSSHPRGEALTGVLRSPPFPAPARLSFFLAGHDGTPDREPQKRNRVQLRDAAGGQVLREAFPPRQDTARRVEWDLADLGGRRVRLEVVDGDTGDAYAWLAVGRVEPATVPGLSVAPSRVAARQAAAAALVEVAGGRAENLKAGLLALSQDAAADPAARAAAFRALHSEPLARAIADLVADATLPLAWRARTADLLFNDDHEDSEVLVEDVWKNAPHRFQVRFAGITAAEPAYVGALVERMADGRAPSGLLADRGLRERLKRAAPGDDVRAEIDRLASGLPSEDETARKLLDARRAGFATARTDLAKGRQVFVAGCAACHQINGEGGLVGPQLTGIGTRGAERLCEDILVPNRNVDHAFWTTVLTLKDGETTSGLFRREEGELLVLANAAGTEFTVPKAEVAGRRESNVSVMPSNFGEALSAEDFHHLLAYLLSQTGKP